MTNAAFIESKTGVEPRIETKTFKIEVLTPVHIGSGREFTQNLDLVCTSNNTILLDMAKIFRKFGDSSDFLKAIEGGNVTRFIEKNGGAPEFKRAEFPGSIQAGTCREFMTLANGKPVIPGSSIKGSLRTAVYKQLLSDGKFPTDQYSNLKGKMASDSFLAKLFSPNTPQKESPMNFDLGRAIRVFDGTVESSSCNAFNAYVFNSTTEGGKWKNSSSRRNVDRLSDATPISFIGLRPGSVPTKIEISLDNQIATNIGSPAILQTWSGLRKMNQDLAGLLYDSEYNYFDRFESTEVGKKILDQLSIVLDAIEENRPDDKIQWVQRIGWGSGWTSITADSISDADFLRQVRLKLGLGKVRKNKELNTFEILADEFPKTRKLVHFQDEIWTMGWIKVTEV